MGSSMKAVHLLCLVFLFVEMAKQTSSLTVFDVLKFGAVTDGKTDSSTAFMGAWKEACELEGGARVVVPKGDYFINPVKFEGPCKGYMEFEMEGLLKGPKDLSKSSHWIQFIHLDKLKVTGHGTIDGQGDWTWAHNHCRAKIGCIQQPASIQFDDVSNSIIESIHSLNSKMVHINISGCKNVTLQYLTITAPENSPNTDGIHIGNSQVITILQSTIGTGDDCISLSPGTSKINALNVTCGPGHGISVGSMGGRPRESVNGLLVKSCTFIHTSNGVRIKTWSPSHSGIARDLTFQDIHMDRVFNPIIIDQEYCPARNCTQHGQSKVRISDVTYDNIWGSSTSKVAVNLQCSGKEPCQNITLKDINLVFKGKGHGATSSSCVNVKGSSYGKQIPPSCIGKKVAQ